MSKSILFSALLLNLTVGICQTKTFIDQPYIEVTGQADTLVIPNEIFIRVIISERDSKDKISLEDLESKMITALKDMSINTEQDLTTSDMLSNYRFYFLKKKDILKTKEYILKVTDAATASKVFLKLEDIEISNSSIDRVENTEFKKIENICRTKAIIAAKRKASSMTKPLNQSVGRAIFISETGQEIEGELQGRVAGIQIRGYSSNKSKYEPPKIEFQKIRISANVNVKFILE